MTKKHDDPYLEYLRQGLICHPRFTDVFGNYGDEYNMRDLYGDGWEAYYQHHARTYGPHLLSRIEWSAPDSVPAKCTCAPLDAEWCDYCLEQIEAQRVEPAAINHLMRQCQTLARDMMKGGIVKPTACIPDDQPEDYLTRRERVSAERNPQQKQPPDEMYGVCPDPRGVNIARAVNNLNFHEYRLGASRFQP